jgi:DNA-binding winged helix-turn-helix (wHTH) protein
MRLDAEPDMNPNEGATPSSTTGAPSGVVQFDGFELRLETGELRRNGMRVRLQTKPFQILTALLERPGRVVTRDELRMRLWPSDTFVDFESGLNTAANRLRIALGDSAENPRYIETLSRIGYRFVAPVRRVSPNGVVEMIASRSNSNGEDVPPIHPAEGLPSQAAIAVAEPVPAATAATPRWRWIVLVVASILALIGLGGLVGRISAPRDQQSFHQISFRRGVVTNARFTPSGEVVYSARWGSDKPHLYLTDTLSPESRDLGVGDAGLASVSASSELAIFQLVSPLTPPLFARVPMHGGAPRVISKSVVAADFSALTGELCIVARTNDGTTVEMPPGNVIYRSSGWSDAVRVAPDGRSVALLEHELNIDDAGGVVYIDRNRNVRKLSSNWASIAGLAWAPSGDEVWFSAARSGSTLGVWGVSLEGRVRPVSMYPGSFVLFDIARDGRVLASRLNRRLNLMTGDARTHTSEEASWFDWTRAVAISDDGDRVIFDETGAGGGEKQAVYLRHMGERTVERVGDGHALDLAGDGRSALTQSRDHPTQLTIITWPDVRRTISASGLNYQSARFIPGRNSILVQANAPAKPVGLYVQDLSSSAIRPLKGFVGVYWPMPSPDGLRAAGMVDSTHVALVDLDSGAREDIVLPRAGSLVRWNTSSRLVFMEPGRAPIPLWTFDLKTHKAAPLFEIAVPDPLVRGGVAELVVSANMRTFAYSYIQSASELLLVDGWK